MMSISLLLSLVRFSSAFMALPRSSSSRLRSASALRASDCTQVGVGSSALFDQLLHRVDSACQAVYEANARNATAAGVGAKHLRTRLVLGQPCHAVYSGLLSNRESSTLLLTDRPPNCAESTAHCNMMPEDAVVHGTIVPGQSTGQRQHSSL